MTATRLHYVTRACLTALLLLCAVTRAADLDSLRGEQVGWARLKTPSPVWRRHAETDPRLMDFFRDETTLNVDRTWYAADPENLDEICAYPFLFSQSIHPIESPRARRNLGEYMRRGGFLLIDACINPWTRGKPDVFLAQEQQAVTRVIPEARILLLSNQHDIYHCLFNMPDGPPHTEDHDGWGDYGFYAIYIRSRMVGIISLSGLQCGWAGMKPVLGHDIACMRMLVNIYVYAMLQGG